MDICRYELASIDDNPLPAFSAGAHKNVHLPDGLVRQYSLCNHPEQRHRYLIGHATNMLQTGQWANLLKYEIAPEPNQDSQKPRTASKVKVARDYVKTNPEVDFSPLDLRERITHLCDFIVRSNHYDL